MTSTQLACKNVSLQQSLTGRPTLFSVNVFFVFLRYTSQQLARFIDHNYRRRATQSIHAHSRINQPFDAHCCHIGTAMQHPVPDRVKPSFLTSGHSDAQPWASECPDVKNYKWRLNPVWCRMLYMATVGVKGLTKFIDMTVSGRTGCGEISRQHDDDVTVTWPRANGCSNNGAKRREGEFLAGHTRTDLDSKVRNSFRFFLFEKSDVGGGDDDRCLKPDRPESSLRLRRCRETDCAWRAVPTLRGNKHTNTHSQCLFWTYITREMNPHRKIC